MIANRDTVTPPYHNGMRNDKSAYDGKILRGDGVVKQILKKCAEDEEQFPQMKSFVKYFQCPPPCNILNAWSNVGKSASSPSFTAPFDPGRLTIIVVPRIPEIARESIASGVRD